MRKLHEKLSEMSCVKILDIATRDGAFIHRLSQGLKGYDEMIGIDISEKGFAKAKAKFGENDRIRFQVMDGCHTDFEDQSFDLVCLSNSLHHIEDMTALFNEMRRLKKDDGCILISEMPADGQTGASLTHALIHRLDCLIDTYQGNYHHLTYTHEEINDMVSKAGLEIIDAFDDAEIDLLNDSLKKRAEKALDKANECSKAENFTEMHDLALKIQENFQSFGVNSAVQYVIFAR
ncbi:class I SAM-dependent methyltransferase [Dehalobacterium formicoaceticum]|uniref:Methyltransferase domain-containing protein n=1 Tax=Dehalobacterium formicoaceticum TaxID=51515 RepID=A0ABT1Y4F8_9FIRM|nr:class I SAM-dependent methyltransferase [Dehalobacterium formicoaceticum]MCR6545020.1 methyltransferase domain-containing protein [Dehalobacterium formicoaceticum]